MANLVAALASEIKRNQELVDQYKELPNGAGMFGATMIQQDIARAIAAMESGDIESMLTAYNAMKDNE